MEIKNRQLSFEEGYASLNNISVRAAQFSFLSKDIMKKHCFVPIDADEEHAYVVMSSAEDVKAVERVQILLGRGVYAIPAAEDRINNLINAFEEMKNTDLVVNQLKKLEGSSGEEKLSGSENSGVEASPAVRVSNSIITQAINAGASDIHIEPFEKQVIIRFRIDGVLQDNLTLPLGLYQSICSRLKLEANMDIAEKRMPQDGKWSFNKEHYNYDLRVSTLPTIYGEKLVIRLLHKDEKLLKLSSLGFSEEYVDIIKQSLNSGSGMIIVTGPTGSGKTTTLYSMLSEVDRYHKNIVAIEDPSEIFLDRVSQVNVNQKTGLTFANGLRSILRQDPDVIMVGEIRDSETAQVAVSAAITGHLVLSTLHTNDAASSVTRLVDMGIPSFLLADALKGCVAQRLARRICSNCKEAYKPSNSERLKLGLGAQELLYKGKGCVFCSHTGYKSRIVVSEIMVFNREMKNLIGRESCTENLRALAQKAGMKTLEENGADLVKNGITTYEEYMKLISSG